MMFRKRLLNVLLISLLAALVVGANIELAYGNYDPHPDDINYDERYRPQYHFSPKTEWMNDINGLWYLDGKYHMIYQWGDAIRHGGYATSPDLLHWTDEGVALIPQDSFLPEDAVRNVSGSHVFSGSGVVVKGKTAKKITGSEKEAMVAIYTGTKSGTCLAWSNDAGKSWHDYKENPVANPTDDADPRDPAVFWHEPTSKWILALYEEGTTFYGSEDLIEWKFLSNIDFGFECPDLFELPLDGDKNKMKWILQDANGTYLVGHFDGKTFKPEQKELIMDVGPDFYAAQSFFRPNFPNDKVIQIAWNDHWNGGIDEEPYARNATFPVEVNLVTRDGKMRTTRTPIEAISKLYESTKKWDAQKIQWDSRDLLADVRSKKFELTAEFDLEGATAHDILFKVANKLIDYNLKKQELLGKSLKPNADNKVKIRILVDWSTLEIFADEGVYSYSEQFAFTPDDDSLSLYVNGGDVKLVSMEFHEIARTWPGKAK
ncbi:MAG: glycoside hydrolase family 32 protein [Planctomycetota bacterium]|jgi:levanase/fructan beta-fructosidase